MKNGMMGLSVPLMAGLLAAGLPAWNKIEGQGPASEARAKKALPAQVWLRNYAPQASRRAFSACDLDRDDRITFREAHKTLGLSTPQAFALWDTDRDGWIHFPEFDRRYKQLVRDGWGLTLRGPAVVRAPKDPPPSTLLPLKKLFQTLDRNGDGRIEPAEWRGTTRAISATLSKVPSGFFGLDRNRDGTLELEEMAPLLALFPGLSRKETPPLPLDKSLPADLQGADRNGDQHLDLRELEFLFRKLDPGLVPWARILFQKKDKNQDGLLSPRELRAGKKLPRRPAGPERKRPSRGAHPAPGPAGGPRKASSGGAALLPRGDFSFKF